MLNILTNANENMRRYAFIARRRMSYILLRISRGFGSCGRLCGGLCRRADCDGVLIERFKQLLHFVDHLGILQAELEFHAAGRIHVDRTIGIVYGVGVRAAVRRRRG